MGVASWCADAFKRNLFAGVCCSPDQPRRATALLPDGFLRTPSQALLPHERILDDPVCLSTTQFAFGCSRPAAVILSDKVVWRELGN